MGDTTIEWTDKVWNPTTGCTKVSPGCDNCYAETFSERWRGVPGHYFEQGFDIQLRPNKLAEPLKWRAPKRVFVNSMSDLFHQDVPDDYIGDVFAIMALSTQHTFQVLTKRHARMRALLSDVGFQGYVAGAAARLAGEHQPGRWHPGHAGLWPLPNVWIGVSVESQQWAHVRIPALLGTPAAIRFLSCEPLLGPLDLQTPGPHRCEHSPGSACPPWYIQQLDWVIAGGESGPGARPMNPDWARGLRDQCQAADVAFHFKQWGAHAPRCTLALCGTPCSCNGGNPTHPTVMRRVGKGAAGRELDGRTWDQMPDTTPTEAVVPQTRSTP